MNRNICAVVVTFNRKELLRRCLTGLLAQTLTLDKIIVVNNASEDGTKEMLASDFPFVEVLNLSTNTGGAGGFFAGCEKATELNYDWFWLMDDDGLAAADCLEKLVLGTEKLNLDLAGPLVLDVDNPAKLAFGLRDEWDVNKVLQMANEGVILRDCNPFNGTLLRRRLVERIGKIKKEMFIWGDETEYVLRAIRAGARVGTLVEAVYRHPRIKGTFSPVWGGLLGKCLEKPVKLRGVHYRNIAYINSKYGGFMAHAVCVVKHMGLFIQKRSTSDAINFTKYYIDGALDRFTLPPSRMK